MPPLKVADAILGPVRQADRARGRSSIRVLSSAPPSPYSRPKNCEVLARGQVRVDRELLGHVADAGLGRHRADVDRPAVERDLAAVAGQQPADHRDRRRLARTVRAEQAVGLALVDLEADATDGLEVAVALAQVDGREDDGAHPAGRVGALLACRWSSADPLGRPQTTGRCGRAQPMVVAPDARRKVARAGRRARRPSARSACVVASVAVRGRALADAGPGGCRRARSGCRRRRSR